MIYKVFFSIGIFLLLCGGEPIFAQGKKQTLIVSKINGKKGRLYIAWYNKADDFKKTDKAVYSKVVEVTVKDNMPIVFENVPPGTYAIALFLDENRNGKMDTNFLGIPKEKYGFSNNVYPLMRAATYKEASFSVTDKEASINIQLN
jgi:uncharacterized protein (DUF2141 family)